MNNVLRNDWTIQEIHDIYNMPLLELVYRAATIHREYNDIAEVQVCTLLSIKTGGCTEDCAYCPQAARYHTGVKVHALMQKEEIGRARVGKECVTTCRSRWSPYH